MRTLRASLVALAALPLAFGTLSQTSAKPVTHKTSAESSAAVQASAIVIDTHADTTQRMLDDHYDLTQPLDGGSLNFASARQGHPALLGCRRVERILFERAEEHEPDVARRGLVAPDGLGAHAPQTEKVAQPIQIRITPVRASRFCSAREFRRQNCSEFSRLEFRVHAVRTA